MSDSGRRWLEVAVRSDSGGVRAALIVEGLIALGGRAAEERDGWYVTHLDSPHGLETLLTEMGTRLAALTGLEDLELRATWREHEDWAETWKRGLGFRRITDRVGVRPSWIDVPADAPEVVVVLDPGMAFGTAEHGTTRGCLRLLDGAVAVGERVLDVGAGSGILAIAAAHLGAAEVVALEADPLACQALDENLERNGVADRVRCVRALVGADDLAGYGPADGVVANIESGTLRRLAPGFAAALHPGGWLIVSGILEGEWPTVRDVVAAAGFDPLEVDADGAWRAGLFRRRVAPPGS